MTCDCVEEEVAVLRKINTTLRTMNRSLRNQLRIANEHSDELFMALCNEAPAEALGELWEFGQMDCSPEDYGYIVERCLEALEYSEHRKPFVPTSGGLPDEETSD